MPIRRHIRVSAMIDFVKDDLLSAATFGPDQNQQFLSKWYGPPSRAPRPGGLGLPRPLNQRRGQVARWGESVVMTL